MDFVSLLITFFYVAGDVILYRGLLGYRFQQKKGMLALGMLCAAGYIVLPASDIYFPWIYWAYHAMLFAAEKFSFDKIKGGLIFFVIAARRALGSFEDGILSLLLLYEGDDVETWNLYLMGLNFLFAACVALFCLWKQRRNVEIHPDQIRPAFFWICGLMLSVPTISGFFFGWVINEDQIRVKGVVEDGMLSLAIIGLAVAFLILDRRSRQLKQEQLLNLQCIKEQTEQYKVANEKQQELRAFRHDMNGHILAMRGLAKAGDLEGLQRYLEDWAMIKEEATYISTGHVIGDAIFNHYGNECRKNHVEFKVEGKFRDHLSMAETDLCIILTNLVGNAFEAAMKCTENSYVHIEIAQIGEVKTSITITNPVKEMPKLVQGRMETTKPEKELHGLGIVNAEKAAAKYGGEILFDVEEDQVTATILF